MEITAIVPAWMLDDGEYVGLAPGARVSTGFALEAASVARRSTTPAIVQRGATTILTTVSGRVVRVPGPDGRAGATLLRSSDLDVFVSTSSALPDGIDAVATGFLTVEHGRWAANGRLAHLAPRGVLRWTVTGVRVTNGEGPQPLERFPEAGATEPDHAYLLDLVGPE